MRDDVLQGVPVKVMRKRELEMKPEERLQSEIQIVKGVQGVQVRLQCVKVKITQCEGDRVNAWEDVNGIFGLTFPYLLTKYVKRTNFFPLINEE